MTNKTKAPPLTLPAAIIGTVITFIYTARWYGMRYAIRSAAAILISGTAAEYIAIRNTLLRHHAEPQVAGMPIPILLAWYITVQHLAILARAVTPAPLALPALALSYDAMTDPYGLDNGWWEWGLSGNYASDIAGPNGITGIPLLNFAGWAAITTLVERLAPVPTVPTRGSVIISSTMITPAYIAALVWALQRRQYMTVLVSAYYLIAIVFGLFTTNQK